MGKRSLSLVTLVLLFSSCEEYYYPKLESTPGKIVVESLVTNDPNQNFVKLSMTRDFYGTNQLDMLSGAKVRLVQIGGTIVTANETGPGYYIFPETPIPGKRYMLRISYQQNLYESEILQMPPTPAIDSIYNGHIIKKEYVTDGYGVPRLTEVPSREIYVDAPITPDLAYYRFTWKEVLQWVYTPPAPPLGPPPPTMYGWNSFIDQDLFNLAGPKQFSSSAQIKKHPVLSLAYNSQFYLDSITQVAAGWIIILDEYGISKSSYDFHEELNKQLAAEGSLFDPVLTQVYGNIKCTNDPKQIILGFFDLNSYRQQRYYLNMGLNENSGVSFHEIFRYIEIPLRGDTLGNRPEFWEYNY